LGVGGGGGVGTESKTHTRSEWSLKCDICGRKEEIRNVRREGLRTMGEREKAPVSESTEGKERNKVWH